MASFEWPPLSTQGTVTSVGLSLPAGFTVTGSPVTGSGTLTAVYASQTASKVLASPSGSSGAPTFRALVAADIPALSYVTSVALSLPNIFTVTGSPVTSSGTLTAALATETANFVFAGPPSGGVLAPTFRALVTADIPGTLGATTFSGAITLPTTGGTPTGLSYYEEGTASANFNQGAGAGGSGTSVTITFTRVGRCVTLVVPSNNTMTMGATNASLSTASSTLAARLSPASSYIFPVPLKVNNVVQSNFGALTIGTDGSLTLNITINASSNWTSATTDNGFFSFAVSYTI